MGTAMKYFSTLSKSIPPFCYPLLFLCISILTGCRLSENHSSPYPGYSTFNSVTYYRYGDMGSGKSPVLDSVKLKIMEVAINFSKLNDSVFWSPPATYPGYPFYFYFGFQELARGTTFRKHLLKAKEGDSIIYIIPSDSLFKHFFHLPLPLFLSACSFIKVHVRVVQLLDSVGYKAAIRKIREYRRDMDMQEQLKLLHYVTSMQLPDSDRKGGIYIQPLISGSGPFVADQKLISIAYKGYFLDGRRFDSVSPENPLQFRLGDKEQIVPGLEMAIKMMRQGEEAKIIIPSQLAFGEKGSLLGIVPPYATLIYKVKIVEVKN